MKNINKKNKYVPYIFILPVILFMGTVFLYPLVLTFKYSFFKMLMFNKNSEFIGLTNYINLFNDIDFIKATERTFMWTFSSVFIKIFFGLVLALLLSEKIRGIKIYRVLLLITWAIPHSVSAIIWQWIYDGNYGYLNFFLQELGVISQKLSWLGERKLAFIATVINDSWAGIPFTALIFLSGIQAIPISFYEAAEVDGVNRFQRLIYITLPQLKNMILVVSTLIFIWTFNSFNIIWILTKGGPVDSTETLIIKIYRQAFGKFDIGMSSTMSVIIFFILITFSVIYWKMTVKDEY